MIISSFHLGLGIRGMFFTYLFLHIYFYIIGDPIITPFDFFCSEANKEIHGMICPIQIFTTNKYRILFLLDRPCPERRKKVGMPTGVYYGIHPTRESPLIVVLECPVPTKDG